MSLLNTSSRRAGAGAGGFQTCPTRTTIRSVRRRPLKVSSAALDPDNANVLVCGGGGVGFLVSKKLKDMGSWVWCMQRSETRRSQIEGMMALFAKADALNMEQVEKVFDGIDDLDAVVSTIGGTVAEPLADSQGNINIIEAAKKRGVKKFVLVTSIGAGDSKDATPPSVYETLEPVLVEKQKAEEALKESGMDYVIVRPGGLKNEPGTGSAKLTEDNTVCGAIHREDVADLVIKVLLSDVANGKTLSAVDPAQMFGEPQFESVEV